MVHINKRQKQLIQWLIVLLIVGIIIYTFRDMAGPILSELKRTTPAVVIGICIMAMIYHLLEGLITTILAKQYDAAFTYRMGVANALLCSFYRVATLGSGAGVAAIVYLKEKGLTYSQGFGLYMLQYAIHKISIAIYSVLLFILCFSFMYGHFSEYLWLLAAGYLVTLVITVCLILFACSVKFHDIILALLDFVNRKCKGRFQETELQLKEQCHMLEEASSLLMQKKWLIFGIVLINLLKFCFFYGIPYLSFREYSNITLFETMAITSLSVMLAAVLPAPAGIGSTEFVFTSLFAAIVETEVAGSASLLYRFGTFVFPFLVGAVLVIWRRIRSGKHRKEGSITRVDAKD